MEKIRVEKLSIENIDKYLEALNDVIKNMSNPEWIGDFTRDDYIFLIKNNIIDIYTWLYNNNYVGAASLIKVDDITKHEYLLDEYDLNEIIDFGPIWVSNNYTGHGYQVMFIKYLEKRIGNKYNCMVTTIDPNNLASIHNFQKCGFKSIGEVNLKRGKRLVLKKIREE